MISNRKDRLSCLGPIRECKDDERTVTKRGPNVAEGSCDFLGNSSCLNKGWVRELKGDWVANSTLTA